MTTEPQQAHQWLQKLVGEWTYEADATLEPGQPPAKCKGSERVRSLGGLWMLAEGQGEMPGSGAAETVLTPGYDPQKPRYVGTWIGSMMTHLWVYDGALDAAGRMLMLNAEGPHIAAEGTMATYKDVNEFTRDDYFQHLTRRRHANPTLSVLRRPLRGGSRVLPPPARRRGHHARALQGQP